MSRESSVFSATPVVAFDRGAIPSDQPHLKLGLFFLPTTTYGTRCRTTLSRDVAMVETRTYLALGDSMSIDDYTGVAGGGAAKQFHRWLGEEWRLDDRTADGCRMPDVPLDGRGEVITLTIGGNDLLWNKEQYLAYGLQPFVREHLHLLERIRSHNPSAILIVGDIYHPDAQLNERETEAFMAANRAIRSNCSQVGAQLAPIYETFRGHEREYLCRQLEPTFRGAEAIAGLFRAAYLAAQQAHQP